MKRILAALLRLVSLAIPRTSVADAGASNIEFIFSDDHAEHVISACGSKVNQTPHLDRLAHAGARFTNSFVTNWICTPSRATLLTGQNSHLNGVPVFNRFDPSRDTVDGKVLTGNELKKWKYHRDMQDYLACRASKSEANKPEVAAKFTELKAEIVRLQSQFKNDGQYADASTWPKGGADGPFDQKPLGVRTITNAIESSGQR